MSEVIFFHEDFYRMIELIPKQNYFATNRAIEELPHVEGTESGFFNCNIIPEHPVKVETLKIPFDDIKNILEPLALSFHNTITSGYSTTTYNVDDTVAWGFERYGLFIEYSNNMTKSIWLCNSAKFSKCNLGQSLFKAIFSLATNINLILVDWNRDITVDISNKKKLKDYLNQVLAFDISD